MCVVGIAGFAMVIGDNATDVFFNLVFPFVFYQRIPVFHRKNELQMDL
jgi:hypothetical protein